MALLIASIIFQSLLTFVFKLFPRFKVDNFIAIIINYFICYICGAVFMGAMPIAETFDTGWIWYSLTLSFFFISGFWFVGNTVQRYGIGLATLMQKMSLIISVVYMMVVFGESHHPVKIFGIVLAIISIILYNHKAIRSGNRKEGLFLLPIMTLLVSGIIEIILFLGQRDGHVEGEYSSFVTMIFLGAGVLGLVSHLASRGVGRLFKPGNWIAGTLLGIPNFFSMYFLVRVLDIGWEGSVVFPINNIGVLVLSSLGAMIVFKEEIGPVRWVGLIIATTSIALLSAFT